MLVTQEIISSWLGSADVLSDGELHVRESFSSGMVIFQGRIDHCFRKI